MHNLHNPFEHTRAAVFNKTFSFPEMTPPLCTINDAFLNTEKK